MRLIDADALIDTLVNACNDDQFKFFPVWIEKQIDSQPTITMPKEQETGHCIFLENCANSGIYCSERHTKVFDNYPFKKKFSYFCPHCGTTITHECR